MFVGFECIFVGSFSEGKGEAVVCPSAPIFVASVLRRPLLIDRSRLFMLPFVRGIEAKNLGGNAMESNECRAMGCLS